MKCKYCKKEFECSQKTFVWCSHPMMAKECICLDCIAKVLSKKKQFLTPYDYRSIIYRLRKCFLHKKDAVDRIAKELLVELL